jgi:hypothetical protein
MANLQGTITESPAARVPADLANKIAVVGWFPALNAATPEIVTVQKAAAVRTAAGRGKGADLVASMLRYAQEVGTLATIYCIPHPATVAGLITYDGQTGFGPAATLAALATHPYDDATVRVRIRTGGAPGTATFELSTAFDIARDADGGAPEIGYLWESARLVPALTAAMLTGTIDITGLVYATPATVTGTVDLVNTSALYGPGGALDGTDFDITLDGGAPITVTFGTGADAPADYTDVLATIEDAITTGGAAAVSGSGYLVLTGVAVSSAGSIVLAAGASDALVVLGLTAATTNGVAGILDGKTIVYEGDATSGAQTWTIPSAGSAYASATAFVAAATARTGVDASVFSTANFLRIGSSTAGAASTFQINSGTALSVLGLSAASATGADSEYEIEHLGVKITFASGMYTSGYERSWTLKAPYCSADDIGTAIDAIVAQELRVGRVVIASHIPLAQVSSFVQAASSAVADLEAANDARFLHVALLAPIGEADADVRAEYIAGVAGDAAVGRRVDIGCRSGYVRPYISSPSRSGSLLRSGGWAAAWLYAAYPLGSDLGQHNLGPIRYLDYVAVDEDAATVKMALLRTDTTDPRANVIQRWGDGYYFAGGFTLAPPSSTYADQYVRDIILRVAALAHAGLKKWLNDPSLPLTSAGKLTEEGAGAVASTVTSLVSILLPQPGAENSRPLSLITALSITVDQSEVIGGPSGSQRLKADIVVQVRGIARAITFTVGAGLITAEEG